MNIDDYVNHLTKEQEYNHHSFRAGGVRIDCCDVKSFSVLTDFSFIVRLKDGRFVHEKMDTAYDKVQDLLEWTAK